MNKQTEALSLCRDLGVSSPGRERMLENVLSQSTSNPLTQPEMVRKPKLRDKQTTIGKLVKGLFVTALGIMNP
jgi:hypothetical protein